MNAKRILTGAARTDAAQTTAGKSRRDKRIRITDHPAIGAQISPPNDSDHPSANGRHDTKQKESRPRGAPALEVADQRLHRGGIDAV